MGCCLSTLEENKTNPKSNSLEKTPQFSCVSKSPPRPEEETVKEVLSETPKPKPNSKPEPEPGINVPKNVEEPTESMLFVSPKKPFLDQKLPSLDQKLSFFEKKMPYLEQNMKQVKETKHHHNNNHPDPTTPEEISEVSELCSLSETISNTTLDEQHQCAVKDSATSSEVRQRVYRSQGQNSNFHHNNYNNGNNHNVQLRNHGRSPVRRADPSPPRRRYPGPGPGQVGPKSDGGGENPARRSRSPATRSNVGRSPSARRTGPSPGRVRMVNGPENVRKVEEENVSVSKNENDGPNESLENPLVSLECFIFL